MPFFGNKFSPKKAPSRKKNSGFGKETVGDLVTDQRNVHLQLNEQQFIFENGEWIPETGGTSAAYKSNKKLKKKLQDLEEENNLLQLKYEMVINMLTQATAENHANHKEMETIKKGRRNRSKS
ncbi:hypothetical protein NQ318_010901 [Aromia moschata]|uniref:Chibby n=1 Tax=Aromia moschata TaxID=1265417 RepID=A0AAV8XKP2_9CUCU|nr:hypothetical protein NQ318_010901 [Aromia moschata]